MSVGCKACTGEVEPFVVNMTGAWAHLERVVYGGVSYFVHGAVFDRGATTLWLVPLRDCS